VSFCEAKHFNFRKLVQPVKSVRVLASPGFSPETVTECHHLVGESISVDKFVSEHASERDLTRSNQAITASFDPVDLRCFVSWLKSTCFYDLRPSNVRSHQRLKSFLSDLVKDPVA